MAFVMDKADDTFDEGDRYAKRLLERSQYSDCHSPSYHRRLSVMEALSKSSVNTSAYDCNPFEKEFSEANKMGNDQLDMTFVSVWPEDNAGQSTQTLGAKPQDSQFCVKSTLGAKATNRPASEYRNSDLLRRDVVDSDAKSIPASDNLKLSESYEARLSIGERFGSLSSNEMIMQRTLNRKYENEFAECNAQMQRKGVDKFFGVRSIETCEPTIIEYHRKSCDSLAVETQTREVELAHIKNAVILCNETYLEYHTALVSFLSETAQGRIATDLDASEDNAAQTHTTTDRTYVKEDKGERSKQVGSNAELESSSIDSEGMRDLDLEIDKLQFDDDHDFTDNTAPSVREISKTFEIVSGKRSKDIVDGKHDLRGGNYVMTTGRPINRSMMENFDGNQKPRSPENATFSISPTPLENSTRQQREHKLSKTASFIKRHTSFLFKNLRTPKLVRRKSSVESTRKTSNKATGSPWSQASTSALARSNTVGSSDNDKLPTRFQKQMKQVQADLPADMDDTITSEMESFLKIALGSGQYNSTMAQANFDAGDQSYSILNNNATYSESKNNRTMTKPKSEHTGTLNRTHSIYKTLTKKIRNKFRKYDHSDMNLVMSNFDQQNVILENLSQEMREILKPLQNKLNIQNTLIHQASKALQLCDSMPEFTASTERVEYERLLLLAILTKNVVWGEIGVLINQKTRNKKEEYAYTERGEVTLKDIRLDLREDVTRIQNGDTVEWFVVVVIQGVTVWATHAIACPISSPQIYFPGVHVISGLTPDFRLSIKVYSMKLKQLKLFNHDDKYHITRSYDFGSNSKIKSPKILRSKSFSPKQHKVKYTGIKETSFAYCGGLDLMLYDLKLPSPWPLNSLSPNSVLHGTVELNFSCKLELSMFHAGFLTHCEDTGDLAWNRRWCLLEGHKMLFWNYPRDQEYNPPIYIIDLVNCVSRSIDLVDRRLCPRPRTLLLETKNRANEKNHIVIEGRPHGQITRHMLAFDNNNELADWHSILNHVISALCDWNIIQTE